LRNWAKSPQWLFMQHLLIFTLSPQGKCQRFVMPQYTSKLLLPAAVWNSCLLQSPNIATDYHVQATHLLQSYANTMSIVNYLKNVQYYNAVAYYANLKHVNEKYCDTKILPTVHFTLKISNNEKPKH
jgi:hypothetical protein